MIYNIKANAKINIGLNIEGKLENGYHILDMIMVPVDLADELRIKLKNRKGDLKISTNKPEIPIDKKNILYRVYEAFFEEIKEEKQEIEIYLKKIIPHEAGLGGGSSDGAAFLKFLNEKFGNRLSEKELIKLGGKIGADIPFFIVNKSARVQGVGEQILPIENNLKCKVIIIKPKFGVSTKIAYENYENLSKIEKADILEIKNNLKKGNWKKFGKKIQNGLEQAMLLKDENLKKFKERVEEESIEFYMSGSGSAYYAFVSEENAVMEYMKYQQSFDNCEVFLCGF